jgi:3',5'-cyclic AMP phosphodiesterase CpdA
MITLAHMSDVHLAPLPPVRWGELINKRFTGYLNWRFRRHNTLSGEGLTNLVRHMREQSPDFTAITGDLVNLGLEAEANTTWNWLQTVGSPDQVCVSPGNHDAYVKPTLAWNSARWGEYMRGETIDDAQFPFVRRVGDLAIISCSSAVATLPFSAAGRFDVPQAQRLGRVLKLMGDAGYFRVIMIHHPPNL